MPGNLILLRHGESEWNAQDRFTGWTDVPLSANGRRQAQRAGALLRSYKSPGVIHTSQFRRAIETVDILRTEARWSLTTVRCAPQLNERDYGELEGWRRSDARRELGVTRYDSIHRGWYDKPPTNLSANEDVIYARTFYPRLTPLLNTPGEALADVYRRVLSYWSAVLREEVLSGETVFVVGHSNSLRALLRYLHNVPIDEVALIEVKVGVPMFVSADAVEDWTGDEKRSDWTVTASP